MYIKSLKHLMQKYGTTASLHLPDGWCSCKFSCFLQPLGYKNKMYLEGINTKIGVAEQGYYLYLGPPEHDLSKLDKSATVKIDEKEYMITRSEKIYLGEYSWYTWAVLVSCCEGV